MSDDVLRVFVYGTLKRGERNHARYCSAAVAIEPARLNGRLFFLPAGYPMLQVPQSSILAVGTDDSCADLATQSLFGASSPHVDLLPSSDWETIDGEVLSFVAESPTLTRLDYLEDYRPDDPDSTYLRVLVPLSGSALPAWTYVAPQGRLPTGCRRIGTSWP